MTDEDQSVARQLIAFGRLKPAISRPKNLAFICRKTTNRLRAIETLDIGPRIYHDGFVARQLIAFGRLKLRRCGVLQHRRTLVARQLIAFGRLKHVLLPEAVYGPLPGRKTTNRLRAIETESLQTSPVSRGSRVARQLIAFGRLKPEINLRWDERASGGRKTTNRLRAIETSPGNFYYTENPTRRKTTNRRRAIETHRRSVHVGIALRGRKTTNRLRAIETLTRRYTPSSGSGVARQLIAFGRLKLVVEGAASNSGYRSQDN